MGTSLSLKQGAVSKAILAEAGQALQQECSKKVPGGNLQPWTFIDTPPAALHCRVV